jgi:hypothetical protein
MSLLFFIFHPRQVKKKYNFQKFHILLSWNYHLQFHNLHFYDKYSDLTSDSLVPFLLTLRAKKKEKRKMPSINTESFLWLKDLLLQKIIEFLLGKLFKIFFLLLIFFIIFHPSISNFYGQTRKRVENYGQSSLAFNSIQIADLPITELTMPIKHSPLITSSELFDNLINYIDKARIVDKNLQTLQIRTKSSIDNLITYLMFALKIFVKNKVSANDAYYQATTYMESELRKIMPVFHNTLKR